MPSTVTTAGTRFGAPMQSAVTERMKKLAVEDGGKREQNEGDATRDSLTEAPGRRALGDEIAAEAQWGGETR